MTESKPIRNMVNKAIIVIPLLLCINVISINSKQAFAQSSEHGKHRIQRIRSSHNPSPIQEAINTENFSEANRLIDELEKNSDLTPLESAYLANYRGNICFTEGDLDCAFTQFNKIVGMGDEIPESFRNQILYVLTQVSFSQEKYRQALNYAERYSKTLQEPSADISMLCAQAHYQLNEYDKALPNALNAIENLTDKGKLPKEGWLNLLVLIYLKIGQAEQSIPILEQLIKHYPNEAYQLKLDEVKKGLGRE